MKNKLEITPIRILLSMLIAVILVMLSEYLSGFEIFLIAKAGTVLFMLAHTIFFGILFLYSRQVKRRNLCV